MNLFDYIKDYGFLTFEEFPFNEVDNLIFSYLAYVNLDSIYTEHMSIKEASDAYFMYYSQEELDEDKSFTKKSKYAMREMAKTRRFSTLKICNYINITDEVWRAQFAALTIELDEHSAYVSYRGTDDNIFAWKECFSMSIGIIPAQDMAARYLNTVGNDYKHLIIGGHSKGGNLAIYASAKCSSKIKSRITTIYSNDGPGFLKEFVDTNAISELADKIIHIIPENAVIGMLMESPVEPTVIKSNAISVIQHDSTTWLTDQNRFIRTELAITSKKFHDIVLNWLIGIPQEQRIEVIDDLFSILEASGAHTITDLQNIGFNNWAPMSAEANNASETTKKVFEELFLLFYKEAEDSAPILQKIRKILNIPIDDILKEEDE
ncbi:MAG: DUF2974 domain-containing protein [Erysipelotrichaceae bacterium]|nr:DUF2974 domain-containing protein [Erysipelotrichaceae bacterium]